MDRRIFQGTFTKAKPPQWPCPECGKCILQIIDKTFSEDEGAVSSEAHSCEGWDTEWIEYRFVCLLKCTNPSCAEIVSCAGVGGVYEDYGYDFNGTPTRDYIDWFKPKYFDPCLIMMDIPPDTPDEVFEELRSSFSLFYSNPSAAANCTRMAVEALLTSLGVKRFTTASGQRKPIALHHRIESLPPKLADVRDLLRAVKWIGNHGSHSGKQVTAEALLDSYDLLEAALEGLYSNKRQQIMKVAKAVNKRKAPRKS